MRSVAFALRFAGEAVELDGGRYWAETQALAPAVEAPDEIEIGDATCRRQLDLWADGSLVEAGEISFGDGGAITFRARGALGASPEPGVRHGTAILEVTGGRGRLAGARGFVTSNFLLSETGELTDHLLDEAGHEGGAS
jgi:hypothetical protein